MGRSRAVSASLAYTEECTASSRWICAFRAIEAPGLRINFYVAYMRIARCVHLILLCVMHLRFFNKFDLLIFEAHVILII